MYQTQPVKPSEPTTLQRPSPTHRNRKLLHDADFMLRLEDRCNMIKNNYNEDDGIESCSSSSVLRAAVKSTLAPELSFLRSLPDHAHRARFDVFKGTDKRHDWARNEGDPHKKLVLNQTILSPRKRNKRASTSFDAAIVRADAAEDTHTNPEKEISFIADDVSHLLFESRTETILGLIAKGDKGSQEYNPRADIDLVQYYQKMSQVNPQLADAMKADREKAEMEIYRTSVLRNCFRRLKLCCIQESYERIERERKIQLAKYLINKCNRIRLVMIRRAFFIWHKTYVAEPLNFEVKIIGGKRCIVCDGKIVSVM